MRVCELAKKIEASSAEVLKRADALGIEAYSALSHLEKDDVAQLQAAFAERPAVETKTAREQSLAVKRAKAVALMGATKAADRAMLEANRQRALAMDAEKHGRVAPAPAPAPVAAVVETKVEAKAEVVPEVAPVVVAAAPVAPVAPVKAAKTAKPAPAPVAKPAPAKAPAPSKAPETHKPKAAKSAPRPVEEDDDIDVRAAPFVGKSSGSTKFVTVKNFSKDNKPSARNAAPHDTRPPARQPNRAQPVARPVATSAAAATSSERVIALRGAIVVKDLADKLGIRPNRLIADLMQIKILASINQRVEVDVAMKIAEKYGFKTEVEKPKRSDERKPILKSVDADDAIPEDKPEELMPRPPIVTILGHVDHGKTSLLDYIRHTHVVKGEAGGITQHIGAYQVEINGRPITFLDTPGHAAFLAMRARGANLADIAIIVVAADDGIMPQTKEAIKHARQAGVQIMIAINKCDKPTAKPDRVRQMLQAEGLTPEEWGGDVICCEVSAITGAGVDNLLEMITLQADMLELQANPKRRANGYVVEAQLEQGLGPTATVLISGGTLNVGDILLCGEYFGRIRGLIDDRGRRVKSAGPAAPVKCMGLSGVPEAGAEFRVMLDEKRARALAERTAQERKEVALSSAKATSLDDLMSQMKEDAKRELSVIVKADTQGSSEAVCEALRSIKSEKVSLTIVNEAIGNVSMTDINVAAAGKAIVLGFNIGCDAGVQQQARHDGVRISTFRIIYELIDFVKQSMLDLLPPEYKEVIKGHAEIKAVYDIGKTGRIAGCQLLDGMLRKDARFRIIRGGERIWDGKLASLKHFKDEVKEITGAQECGIHFNGYEDFAEKDTVECYALEELPRTL